MEHTELLVKPYSELLNYIEQIKLSRDELMQALITVNQSSLSQWRECQRENDALKTLSRGLEKEIDSLSNLSREAKAELLEARSQIASLVATTQTMQSEKQIMEQQISAIRSLLVDTELLPEKSRKQLEFLTEKNYSNNNRASGISVTGIDFDKTDDSSDSEKQRQPAQMEWKHNVAEDKTPTVTRKRSLSADRLELDPPTQSSHDVLRKRSKNDLSTQNPPSYETHVADSNKAMLYKPSAPPLRRSISEPRLADQVDFITPPTALRTDLTKSIPDLLATPKSHQKPISVTSSKKKHLFLSKTVLVASTCDVCEKKINFGRVMLRCLECRTQVHQECRNNAVVPCVSRTPTSKNSKGKLTDYVPPTEPFVPHIVVHLIMEIERRGLNCVGLYRVPGTDSKVKDLLDRFLFGRGVPNLKLIDDVSILTGCLKKFFQHLNEPLIPYTSRIEMMTATLQYAGMPVQMKKIHEAIVQLPLPNRDTLTYLILHLQKVADNCATNKMPSSNLSKIFGPTILSGTYSSGSAVSEVMNEIVKQEQVMNLLLSLPREYWTQYVDISGFTLISVDRSMASVVTTPSSNFSTATTPRNMSKMKTPVSRGKVIQPPWR